MDSNEIINFGAEEMRRSLENIVVFLESKGGKDRTIFEIDEVELALAADNLMATSLLLRDGVVTVGRQVLNKFGENKIDFYTKALRVLNAYSEFVVGLQIAEENNVVVPTQKELN